VEGTTTSEKTSRAASNKVTAIYIFHQEKKQNKKEERKQQRKSTKKEKKKEHNPKNITWP
jgi:hypothetical protein